MRYYTKHKIKIINKYNTKENLENMKDIIEKSLEKSALLIFWI